MSQTVTPVATAATGPPAVAGRLPTIRFVDVRGTRFGGALTFLGAVITLVIAHWGAAAVLATVLLAAAWGGPRWSVWGRLYGAILVARLAPPRPEQREPERPPRFANLLGGLMLAAAVPAYAFGAPWMAGSLVAVVAVLALLNAATGFCLGCRLYGVLVRDGPIVRYLGLR